MAPKKKAETPPPAHPTELLPKGYCVGCEVFWIEYSEKLGTQEAMVWPGSKGILADAPDMVEFENEDGDKGYALEVVEIRFEGHSESQKVSLKSIALTPPPQDAMWNLKPVLGTKRVQVAAQVATLSKSNSRKILRPKAVGSSSPNADRSLSPEPKVRSMSPFLDAIVMLERSPHRADKAQNLLDPSIVDYLNSEEFQDSSTSLGSAKHGWVDWRAIFPGIEELLKDVSQQARLSPELSLSVDVFEELIKRFDPATGRFISNCPRTEMILPFAKFVVTLLYLERQEEVWKRQESERQIKEMLQAECVQEGCPRMSALWDTTDNFDLHVRFPGDFGEVMFREQDNVDVDIRTDVARQATLSRPIAEIWWTDFDPQATGQDAPLCPPVGEYHVWLHMSARQSTSPCHWACQVTSNSGVPELFGGTWHDGDDENINIAKFVFAKPM